MEIGVAGMERWDWLEDCWMEWLRFRFGFKSGGGELF